MVTWWECDAPTPVHVVAPAPGVDLGPVVACVVEVSAVQVVMVLPVGVAVRIAEVVLGNCLRRHPYQHHCHRRNDECVVIAVAGGQCTVSPIEVAAAPLRFSQTANFRRSLFPFRSPQAVRVPVRNAAMTSHVLSSTSWVFHSCHLHALLPWLVHAIDF